ncbi:MAG: hypothetical protein JSW07_02090 [bacterium]|nr:MAG: hypothetical protein JSW07_02090 [bacterium]
MLLNSDWKFNLKELLLRINIDILFGVLSGGVIFLIILIIPSLVGKLGTFAPIADKGVFRIAIGMVGGILGAAGLSKYLRKQLI